MKKAKFVEATEINSKYPDNYVGLELERSKENISLLCVDWKGNADDIIIVDLVPSKYKFKVIDKDTVHHAFSVALKKQEMEAIQAEVGVIRARRNVRFCQNKVKEYFSRPISIPNEVEL